MKVTHEPDDTRCMYYEGTTFDRWFGGITRLVFGDICNECRTLGSNARP